MSIVKIKAKLKEDFSFIKHDGKVLDYLVKEILSENNNELQKTLDFIDTLCKKDVQTRITRIIKELETAGEISLIIKDEIKKDNDKLDKLNTQIDRLEDTISELEETKDELEETISELQINFEKKQNEIKVELDKENENRTKELEKLTNARDNLDTELIKIQSNIDNIFENSYENEFVYNECNYVLTYNKDIYGYGNINHIHYLDISKYCPLLINTNKLFRGTEEQFISYSRLSNEYYNNNSNNKETLKFSFPINIKLMKYEKIIKVYKQDILNTPRKQNGLSNINNYYLVGGCYVVYITNYGRILKSNSINFQYIYEQCVNHQPRLLISNYNDIEYNFSEQYNTCCYQSNYSNWHTTYAIKNKNTIYPLIEAPKLLYRMPRLFLDVIDAFHTQNNDLMQECCKKYLSIARAKGTEKDIINNIEYDRTIQTKDTIISEKDLMIKTQNEIIEKQKEEIEKMKLEITKLKSALLVFTN